MSNIRFKTMESLTKLLLNLFLSKSTIVYDSFYSTKLRIVPLVWPNNIDIFTDITFTLMSDSLLIYLPLLVLGIPLHLSHVS